MDDARLQELRGAVYRGDGVAVVAAVGKRAPLEVLQLAGDGIVVAATDGVAGAAGLAEHFVEALRARAWAGDEELAVELEAAVGHGSPPGLRPLGVDLEDLADVLEAGMGEGGGLLDLNSGEVWPAVAIEYAKETDETPPDFDDPDRWLYVAPEGSHGGYQDMEDFIATLPDRSRAERLARSIDGTGAFRRFKDGVARWPEEEGAVVSVHRRGPSRKSPSMVVRGRLSVRSRPSQPRGLTGPGLSAAVVTC